MVEQHLTTQLHEDCITVMMCGSASGMLLPPYVIYKAEKLWQQWTEMGPKGEPCCKERCCSSGSRYNRTNHGWIDAQILTDWFESAFLPHAKRLPGHKVLLGDNLSSHFIDTVITQCQENNIAFVYLPKNSTPQTSLWMWDFTAYLELLGRSSFQATGVDPIDPERVLRKIPCNDGDPAADVNNTFLNCLQEQRHSAAPTRRNVKRQRLTVEPRKNVTANIDSSSNSDVHESVSNGNSNDEPFFDLQEVVRQESEYFIPQFENIEVGNFILVRVLGGSRTKTVFCYIAVVARVISEQEKQELELLGMKSSDKSRKLFASQ
nr:unnamed protein product [Callosobruchus analis]